MFYKACAALVVAGALTGCVTRNTPQTVVQPLPGAYGLQTSTIGTYTGGELVTNDPAVAAAAENNLHNVVHFAFDSSELNEASIAVLTGHADFLNANPQARVLVAGHTDERGSREYNIALGERRAASVKAFLNTQGVADAAVETMSYGEEQPVAEGNAEEAYAQNRRAELSY